MPKNEQDDIDIQQETVSEATALQLPMNFVLVGEVEHDDLKVYIQQDVYTAIEKLAASDTSRESGSVLIGDYVEDLGKAHVVISAYIEAKYTDSSASTLTFTHETWEYIHLEQERLYPDKKIVGWQHSHPGYGIFLSNYDMFIQENFFNLRFQVAYVVDPVQKIQGFFQWKGGKVEKLKGYHVYDEVGKSIRVEAAKQKTASGAGTGEVGGIRKKLRAALICGAVLFAIAGACIIYLLLGNNRLIAALNSSMEQQALLQSRQAEIDQVVAYYQSLPDEEDIADMQEQIDAQQIVILEQSGTIDELQSQLEELSPEGSDYTYFMVYTIEKGDTLYEICKNYNIDYAANIKVLLGMNGIADADLITVGQTILIPAYMVDSAG